MSRLPKATESSRSATRFRMVATALVLLLVLPAAANYWMGSVERARNPAAGAFYRVDGRKMHLYCIGNGSPTVVLESGLFDDWLAWQPVQPQIANMTRVCSYDRAGLGWSEPRNDGRDAGHIASQLHMLLRAAGESPPYVLAGHSFGGLLIREFTSAFPSEVEGLVFVDSATPEQVEALPGRGDSTEKRVFRHGRAAWQWVLETSGWGRIMTNCKATAIPGFEQSEHFPDPENCRPNYPAGWLGEADEFWHSAAQVAQSRCCGSLPLVIISRDPNSEKNRRSAQAVADNQIRNSLQENLKQLSTRSRRIIARDSTHQIVLDRPDAVLSAIREVVETVRGHSSGARYGTTVVE